MTNCVDGQAVHMSSQQLDSVQTIRETVSFTLETQVSTANKSSRQALTDIKEGWN